jgi:hypothetical protein
MLEALVEQSGGQPWWLGYLYTGLGADTVFPDAPMVSVYHSSWQYLLVSAGAEEAASWRPRDWKLAIPELIFPADRSWLVSTLWDDDWTSSVRFPTSARRYASSTEPSGTVASCASTSTCAQDDRRSLAGSNVSARSGRGSWVAAIPIATRLPRSSMPAFGLSATAASGSRRAPGYIPSRPGCSGRRGRTDRSLTSPLGETAGTGRSSGMRRPRSGPSDGPRRCPTIRSTGPESRSRRGRRRRGSGCSRS